MTAVKGSRRTRLTPRRAAPQVRKAVKWNSPLYGMDGETWFLGLHSFERY